MYSKYEFSDTFLDMYRLFNLRKAKLAQLPGVSLIHNSAAAKLTLSRRSCNLCKQIPDVSNVISRHRSTSVKLRAKPPKKHRTRNVKNYAELLMVTDTSASQQKAKVQMLKPSDLRFLALTDLTLGELYKLKALMKGAKIVEEHTYNNLTIIENVSYSEIPPRAPVISNGINDVRKPTVTDSMVEEESREVVYDDPLDVISISPRNTFQPENLEEEAAEATEIYETKEDEIFHSENPEEQIQKATETEEAKDKEPQRDQQSKLRVRHEIVSRTLAAYVEVCNNLNLPQKGLNALLYHRPAPNDTTQAFKYINVKSVKVYNALLKGFASKGNFPKLEEVLRYARENEVRLNAQSYAAVFECLGRVNIEGNHLKHIRIYAKEAMRNGFAFDKIMNESVFLNDQRRWTLQAMKAYDNNYVPKYTVSDLQYDNYLLNHLNCDEQFSRVFKESAEMKTGIFNKAMLERKVQQQMEIERLGFVRVKSIEAKSNPSEEVLKYREALDEHMKMWEQSALTAFNRDLASVVAQRNHINLEPYLRCIPARDFVSIITDEARLIAQGSETYSPTVGMLYKGLGYKIYSKYKVLRKKKTGVLDKMEKIHVKYCNEYINCHGELDVLPDKANRNLNPRQKWQLMEGSLRHDGASIDLGHQAWVPTVIQALGKFLYNIIMHDIKIDVNVMRGDNMSKHYLPAFYTVFRHQGRIIKEEVKPHPILFRLYRESMPEILTFPSCEVPMICPPVPWCSLNTGGYLVTSCDVVRLPAQAFRQKQRMHSSQLNKLYPAFDSLNQLAAIPWKVNTDILDTILTVFSEGGSAKLDVPELPSSLPLPPSSTPGMDKKEKYAIFRQKVQYRRKKAEMYSLWCDCLYRLSLASHFRNDIFWLPHNMDFRGRVYPVPPHLNHLGSDLARSMLVFAESRPLGPRGLDWLKIHLINLTGLKKRDSIQDRLNFANKVMDKVLDSADRPLTGAMWWAKSDEPWQTLACCMEIAKAVRSPDPVKYRTHFPVHQDGSCNGLQHYAALGRDVAGAYSVNLVPADKPQDVYSTVAALVEERRQKDAQEGHEIAKILEGCVQRKVIKQTVMTTVYGVTRYGARLQIARQLKDLEKFPKESVWMASSYLTSRTFESLRTMFTSTREIQDWFTECARLISSVSGEYVEWITPLGFPIVQPYFRYKKTTGTTGYESFQMDKYEKPNVLKQKNAFPPNFIHSLDSSHMMLTSLHCEKAGVTFVSVHDCYWTHPSTVHIMNKICREQFVALHSEPILEDLSLFLAEKYSYRNDLLKNDGSVMDLAKKKLNKVLRKVPRTGDLDIKEVLNSVYFFS